MKIRPLIARFDVDTSIEDIHCVTEDDTQIGLCRIVRDRHTKAIHADTQGLPPSQKDSRDGPAVLVTHGLTASCDMFVLPETRNFIDVLLDNGYDPWLLDWRGSCRLPYNNDGEAYTLDDVALYDIPKAVDTVRQHIGDKPLCVVAHCVGAIAFGQALTAGLVKGLAGIVTQGVFLTPKTSLSAQMRFSFLSEIARPLFGNTLPVDFRKVGLTSKFTPAFAFASLGASCPDPTCQMLHNSAWGMGVSLFEHDNIHETTHDRLADFVGDANLHLLPHIRKMILARSLLSWNEGDLRYAPLPTNSLDAANTIDCPILLLSGSLNKMWEDAGKLCRDVLHERFPDLPVDYVQVANYGHLDMFLGKGAAIDVFPRITHWLEKQLNTKKHQQSTTQNRRLEAQDGYAAN